MDANSSLRRSGSTRTLLSSTLPCRGSTALKAARQLRSSHQPARLVFLTVHEDADFVQAALDAGGLGYVVKTRLASDLLTAIRAALANRPFISPTIRLDEARLTSPSLPEKPTPTQ
jgi:DNA-binding NarL/FixJ family response regulator